MSSLSTSDSDDDPFQQLQTKSRVKNGKPGQRYVTPPVLDPVRMFYESLYYQNNHSIMACRWCVDYGVLEDDVIIAAIKHLRKVAENASRTPIIRTIDPDSSDAFMSDEPDSLPRVKKGKENNQSINQSNHQAKSRRASKATVKMTDSDAFDSDEDRRIREYTNKLEKSKLDHKQHLKEMKSKLKTPAKSKSPFTSKSKSASKPKSDKSSLSSTRTTSAKSDKSSKKKEKEAAKKPPRKLFRDMLSSDDD